MTIKTWLFLALLAPLTVVGCAGDTTDEPAATASDSEGDELIGSGPNAWQHQALELSCTTPVAHKVTKTSRRHIFSFAGEAGTTTTFTLTGTWPASLGARLYVTDPAGKVIATVKQDGTSTVTLKTTFATTGKHLVFASPIKYQQVAKTYGYTLGAACDGGLRCASASVIWSEGATATSYLQNVSSPAQAEAFFATFPAGATFSQRDGACDQSTMCPALYKPVCGVIGSAAPATFSNGCAFGAALGQSAGHTPGEGSKGYVQHDGECGPVCDYDQADRHYVAQSPDQCKLVKFACPTGQSPFFDDCGCGCEGPAAPVCDYDQPGKTYVGQSPATCQVIKYACPAGQEHFADECGCGCLGPKAPVCDYNEPGKHYVAQSPDQCKLVKFACPKGQTPFFDDCGCGCDE